MGICFRGPKSHAILIPFCNLPQKIIPHFSLFCHFSPIFTQHHQIGVFSTVFFAIKKEYHIIGDECGSSMVCMQPWFTCSFGLHALCSLLYWVQFVKTQGKVQNFIKTACRAADCMGIYSPIPALYGSVLKIFHLFSSLIPGLPANFKCLLL